MSEAVFSNRGPVTGISEAKMSIHEKRRTKEWRWWGIPSSKPKGGVPELSRQMLFYVYDC